MNIIPVPAAEDDFIHFTLLSFPALCSKIKQEDALRKHVPFALCYKS